MKAGPDNMIGVQAGLETGSLRLIGKYADRKLAPYDPSEWHWVVKEGVKTMNENIRTNAKKVTNSLSPKTFLNDMNNRDFDLVIENNAWKVK